MNNTQSNKSIYIFYLYFSLLLCSSSSSFFVRSSSLQGGEPRGPRGDQVDLGQPIAAARPDGVPPGHVGFRVLKSTHRIVLRTALPDGCPSTRAAVHHPRRRGYTVTCSCANTLFGDSAGDEALNGLQPVLPTKRSSSGCCNLQR